MLFRGIHRKMKRTGFISSTDSVGIIKANDLSKHADIQEAIGLPPNLLAAGPTSARALLPASFLFYVQRDNSFFEIKEIRIPFS